MNRDITHWSHQPDSTMALGRDRPAGMERVASRRRVDHQLQKKSERGDYYRAIFDALPFASIALTPEGLIRSWNLGAEKLFGYGEDEVIDRSVSFLTAPQLLGHGPSLRETAWSSNGPRQWQTVKACKDGSLVEVRIHSSPIFSDTGANIGMVWTLRNRSTDAVSAN